ncbi:MAG: helicase SNF2 [Richelia sp. RM1_1_1]|nr:helicase SNF2 [Richelia sp. RM1_1_1]
MYTTSRIESNLKTTPKQRWENNKRAILTLQELKATGNHPTDKQLIELASFNGWGSISQVFSLDPTGWEENAQTELRELLGEAEYNNAAASTLNAHYTDPAIIRSIWSLIGQAGFKYGRILEPACGTGLFFGGMKPFYQEKSELFGVEIDSTASAIAQYLYPKAVIHNLPFESCQFPDGYFDLVVSNVPFGAFGISDAKYDYLGLKIHNYFLAKSSDLVRVGGLIGIITSSYTLDAPGSQHFREWLSKKLKLLTAFRMPNTTFKDIANTEVTTDFLLFQKINNTPDDEEIINSKKWVSSRKIDYDSQNWQGVGNGETIPMYLNQYYYKEFNGRKYDLQYQKLIDDNQGNPNYSQFQDKIYAETQHLFGIPSVNKLYGEGFALLDDDRHIPIAINSITVEECYIPSNSTSNVVLIPPELQTIKEMAFCLHEGNVYQRQRCYLIKVKNVEIERIESFWRLREATIECLKAQSNSEYVEPSQIKLKREYENFIYRWGKVNDKRNVEKLGSDPNYYLVRGLEKPKSNTVADIFHKRVCSYAEIANTASNIHDAIALSMSNTGAFDIKYIARLLNTPIEKVIASLEDKELAYLNPETQEWELKDTYLSSNVYEKLQVAKVHSLTRNIAALKSVLPLPLLPDAASDIKFACIEALDIDWDALEESAQHKLLKTHINANLGAGWIFPKYYEQFASEVLRVKAKITKVDTSNISCWVISGTSRDNLEYGTVHFDSLQILEKAINNQDPRITIYANKEEINIEASNLATEEACNKATLIKKAFADWVWNDMQRCIELCLHYNHTVNVYVDRKYDGSYLTFPGMNPEIVLGSWQRNGAARIIECESTLLGHNVGYGKTFTLITAIMECRRLGLAKRPILIALNGTEQQLLAEWKRLYPTANVLVPSSMNAQGRKYFSAAIASADFDGIILTHSQYFALALSKEYQLEFLSQEKSILRDYLREVKRDRGAAKQIQRALKTIESRITKVTNSERKDNHIDFENLQIDLIAIDEIQMFKNLSVVTKLNNVKGVQTSYSQRAMDNYMKMSHTIGSSLRNIVNKGGKIIGATGTVISNSLCEVYTWLRIFASKQLEKLGISAFDKFMSYFGVVSSGAEISASGQYKVVTRFKSFCNLQPLRALCKQFLDIVNEHTHPDSVKHLEIPETKYIDVVVSPSEAQLKFLSDAYKRAENIQNRKVDPNEDNWLWLTTDFNKCALSARLIGELEEAIGSKLHECAWNIWQIWLASQSTKRTQLVFCDYSTPKSDKYNVYQYMKLLLVALGIPESQVAFIHDYDADARPKLYKLVEQGKVRILFGSTSKLGTGCNIHSRGIEFVHMLDAPWRPADLIQRIGRASRQGNGKLFANYKVKQVIVFRYITERLDALRWQALATKQEFIEKFFNGEDCVLENCEEVVYSYNQVKSLATGNPLLIEEANLRSELNSLLSQLRSHQQQQFSLSYEAKKWESKLANLERQIELGNQDICEIESLPPQSVRNQIGLALNNARVPIQKSKSVTPTIIGKYRSFGIYGHYDSYRKQIEIKLVNKGNYDFNIGVDDNKVKLKISKMLDSIDGLIEIIPSYLDSLSAQIKDSRIEISRCQSLQNKQFDGAKRIDEIKQRLVDIEEMLGEHDAITFNKDEEEVDEETNTTEENEFWLEQNKSVGCITLNQKVIDILMRRSTERVEWLSKYIDSTRNIGHKLTATPKEFKVKQSVDRITTTSTKQLDLFGL